MKTLAAAFLALLFVLAWSSGDSAKETPEASVPSAGKSSSVWYEGSYADAIAEAKGSDKLVFIDFWTSWCGYCKKLDRETFSQPSVQAELAKMISLSVDAESTLGKPLAEKYHVSGYPALVVIDKNQKELGRIAGFVEPALFHERLDKIRARAK